VTIRKAIKADLPRIVELLSQLSLESPREDLSHNYAAAFEAVEADSRQQLLVLEAEQGIVGTLVLVIVPNLSYQGRPWAVIENVVVDNAARGGGYGEQLVRYAIELARQANCHKIGLTSNKQRPEAHRFYERLGFTASHEGFKLYF
jgi:N-acetylglutamate synthase-like GNAT family acetyltransferase